MASHEASTIGLITAELLANSFKHAYPGDAHGPGKVTFAMQDKGWQLAVSDEGAGLPSGFDPKKEERWNARRHNACWPIEGQAVIRE